MEASHCSGPRLFLRLILLACVTAFLAGCSAPAPAATPTPTMVIIKAYPSYVIGELQYVDGCLRIQDTLRPNGSHYLLVFPPDAAAVVEGDEVRITTGIQREQVEETVFRIGDTAFVSGGEGGLLEFMDEEWRASFPEHCEGPYWIVGFEVEPYPAPVEP